MPRLHTVPQMRQLERASEQGRGRKPPQAPSRTDEPLPDAVKRNRHDQYHADEHGCDSYPLAPSTTVTPAVPTLVIPAKAGIHCIKRYSRPTTGLLSDGDG